MKSKATHSVFDTAVYYLTFKDRSEHELKNKLTEKGYSEEEIVETIEKLVLYGYVNDQHYALSYIKSNCKQKGIKKIEAELLAKGIDKDIIRSQIEEADICDEDEYDAILDILNRRFSNIETFDEKQKNKVYSYFIRRGFRYETVKKIVKNYHNLQ